MDAPYSPVAIAPLTPTFDQPPPDESRLQWKLAGGWPMVIVATLLFLVAVGLTIGVAYMLHRDHRYSAQGKTALGTILSKRSNTTTNSKGRKTTSYYVTYAFQDHQNLRRQTEEKVPSDLYYDTTHGERCPIEYLPDDSTQNRLKRDRSNADKWIMGSIAAVLLVVSYLMYFGNRKAARRRTAVVFRGQARPGQIVLSEPQGKGKNRRYVIGYRYIDLAGAEQVSKNLTVAAKVMNQFPRGTVITVLIDPNDPARPEPDLYGVRPLPQM
ncbi:DUF3592 domain-containing protein [Humisphaera borealis]|uniref:DUF3592 domain-containing protein n=1 Tax=Humisphaera borealis TaxID=2807512 RepID=A0A7M2WYX2_9BACT|nr:DUF3592 domain-containing protein [Humisphaera borealis]QOV90412.1 DUF3592 domain-containing protein [Humisphaera borealis]